MEKTFTLKPQGWGLVLSMGIILVRAMQPGAEPVSEWSAASWFWMTLPVTWPWVVALFFVLVWNPFIDTLVWVLRKGCRP